MLDVSSLDELCAVWLWVSRGLSFSTWSIFQDGQLLVSIRVHCDEILGVRVKNQPPAENSDKHLVFSLVVLMTIEVWANFEKQLRFLLSELELQVIAHCNSQKRISTRRSLPASLGSYGNHSSRWMKSSWLCSILTYTDRKLYINTLNLASCWMNSTF